MRRLPDKPPRCECKDAGWPIWCPYHDWWVLEKEKEKEKEAVSRG